jgi:hypothetical protein
MLINKGVTAGEVVSLKLTSGEELVARLVEETATGYRISKPTMITMTQQGLGLMPYMFTVDPDRDIVIHHGAVVVISTTEKAFADQYLQGTTGIKLA